MENIFKSILGEQLSSVEFVQDYLQLHFDENTLTLYNWPYLHIDSKNYKIGNLGYRDKLCEIIGHRISDVLLIENKDLNLFFEGGQQIILSLIKNESNSNLHEFAYFVDSDGGWFVLD